MIEMIKLIKLLFGKKEEEPYQPTPEELERDRKYLERHQNIQRIKKEFSDLQYRDIELVERLKYANLKDKQEILLELQINEILIKRFRLINNF